MDVLVVVATFAAILIAFVVVPEILERRGFDPKGRTVRIAVWATFLALVLIPAALSGFLASVTSPGDWFILFAALVVAILWEWYRLHPGRLP